MKAKISKFLFAIGLMELSFQVSPDTWIELANEKYYKEFVKGLNHELED